MNRTTVFVVAFVSVLTLTTAARADLTFDLRAVSGSQIIIHGPKSVAVTQNSVGGWIDFELWALVAGSNPTVTDEGLFKFTGSMLSTHIGNGAAIGDMINRSELAPGARRGVLAPFDGTAYQNGTVQNLDGDPELEIGGRDAPGGIIAGRAGGSMYWYQGTEELANIPVYRFTLPIASIAAQSLADMTHVNFATNGFPASYIWAEDGVAYSPYWSNLNGTGFMRVNDAVLIHTAQTLEELALIPEPGTLALALAALLGTAWVAIRRRG